MKSKTFIIPDVSIILRLFYLFKDPFVTNYMNVSNIK